MKTSQLFRTAGLCVSVLGLSAAASAQEVRERYFAPNGHEFEAVKSLDGSKSMTYIRNGRTYTEAELKQYIASNPVPVLEGSLFASASANPNAVFAVTVLHKNRPGSRIAREVWDRLQPQFDGIVDETAAIRRSILPQGPLDRQQEEDYLNGKWGPLPKLTAQQEARVRELALLHESITAEARAEIRARTAKAQEEDQAFLARVIAAAGGEIEVTLDIVNGVEARLTGKAIIELSRSPQIARMYPKPVGEPELNNQGASLGLTTGFWANSITGGIWDAGVIDTGVQQDHPNFGGKTFSNAPGQGTTDSDGHGTAVCGILCNNHATNRGMAWGITQVNVGNFNQVQAHSAWVVDSAPDDAEIINLSGGFPTSPMTVEYNDLEKFYDGLIQDRLCLMSKSAGNQGDGTTTITHPAGAYNCIAVANMNDFDTVTRTDDRITSSSSRGPTPGGRFKPDVSAPGNNTTTTSNVWNNPASNPDFITNFGGTSSASPHAAGGILLLVDLRSNDNPYSNKAILINTSNTWTHGSDATSGNTSDDGAASGKMWNKVYGWGYINLGKAYLNGTDVFTSTVDDGNTPVGPDFKLYKGTMFANDKATLVWQRHVGYNGSNVPTAIETFTDLDLLCYRESSGALIDSSVSVIQNVEQVVVAATEQVVLKVECFTTNIDPDIGIESFALATEEGFVAANGPVLSTSATPVADVSPGRTFTFSVQVNNTGDLDAHGVTVDLTLPAGYTLVSGADPQNVGTVPDGSSRTASWRVRAACNTTPATISWTTSSSSYAETWTAPNNSTSVTPAVTPLTSNVVASHSANEKTFSYSMIPQSAGGDWYVVALNPGSADRDVFGDNDLCVTSPYQLSEFIGTTKDFVVANSHIYAPGSTAVTHYALVTFGTDGPYTIEMAAADDIGYSISGVSRADTFATGEIVDCIEVLGMQAGRRYRVTVDVTSGTCNPSLWMYNPSRSDGRRGNPDRSRNSAGAGGDESMIIGPLPESGFYGFVIVNENLAACNYNFIISPPFCVSDVDDGTSTGTPDGGVTIEDLLYYLEIFNAGLIAADVDDGSFTGIPDGGVTIEDLLYFLFRFDLGC